MQSEEKQNMRWIIVFGSIEDSHPIMLLYKLIGQTFWYESNPQRTTGIQSVSDSARALHQLMLVGIVDRHWADMSVERPFYDQYLLYRGQVNQTAYQACDYIDTVIKNDAKKYVVKLRFVMLYQNISLSLIATQQYKSFQYTTIDKTTQRKDRN